MRVARTTLVPTRRRLARRRLPPPPARSPLLALPLVVPPLLLVLARGQPWLQLGAGLVAVGCLLGWVGMRLPGRLPGMRGARPGAGQVLQGLAKVLGTGLGALLELCAAWALVGLAVAAAQQLVADPAGAFGLLVALAAAAGVGLAGVGLTRRLVPPRTSRGARLRGPPPPVVPARPEEVRLLGPPAWTEAPGVCPYCSGPLAGTEVVRCRRCETPHHRECWSEVGRCTRYGCGGVTAAG